MVTDTFSDHQRHVAISSGFVYRASKVFWKHSWVNYVKSYAPILLFPLFFLYGENSLNADKPTLSEDTASQYLDVLTTSQFGLGRRPILKWETKTARVAVVFNPGAQADAKRKLFPELKNIRDTIFNETGFRYTFPVQIEAQKPANVFLVFGSSKEVIPWAQQLEDALELDGLVQMLEEQKSQDRPVCANASTFAEDYSILAAAIVIENSAHTKKCVHEMLISSMGLTGKPEEDTHSVLVDRLSANEITEFDKELLGLLYRGYLSAGDKPTLSEIQKVYEAK